MAKRRVAEIRSLCLDELPYLAIAEVVDEAVALTRVIAMMNPNRRENASGFGRLVRNMAEQRNPWRYRAAALKAIEECQATLECIEEESELTPLDRRQA